MHLNWNEIRARAAAFAEDWKDASRERSETQGFYTAFFHVFGVKPRNVTRYFEHVVKLPEDRRGFVDLFMPKHLLVEQKSKGRNLARAYKQAGDYFDAIAEADRPRHIMTSDFQSFDLRDLDTNETLFFQLSDFPKHVEKFGFLIGRQKVTFKDQDPVNIKAAELVGALHDRLEESGFTGHDLERFLVRIVFCLFADDTGVFEPRDIFLDYLENRTAEDGSDLGPKLAELFQTLNTPEDRRPKHLDEDQVGFPYVNGELFAGATKIPAFNAEMRLALIHASRFDWTPISPAIFGSLFQSVMKAEERRRLGAHYTTEKNILKVIGPLFLEELQAEFERAKGLKRERKKALETLHAKLGKLTFFDPACGCGNFLVIAYRELRQLEIDILREKIDPDQLELLDPATLSRIDVDQFYGIEIEEFPAEIAKAAMWMMDHIMNNKMNAALQKSPARIPLKASPHIKHADALETDWAGLLPPEKCSYVFGNPPFVGHQWRTAEQQAGMHRTWGRDGQVNRLDFVTCWFKKAVEYAQVNRTIRIAFVATNSISQGEQASILWPPLFALGAHIFFAHRTFAWGSEARGKAAVHCVIVGLSFDEPTSPRLFDYRDTSGEPEVISAQKINGYLVEGANFVIPARTNSPPGFPRALQGSKPADGARIKQPDGTYITRSNLILDAANRDRLLAEDPNAKKWLRLYVGSDELLGGQKRWCLWLKDADPQELRLSRAIAERLDRVREGRLLSPTESVREYAKTPSVFTQDRQPNEEYLAIPEVSSEHREYVPMAFLSDNVIGANTILTVAGAELYHFSILMSQMHMAWVRTFCGRLKNDLRYAPTIYNTFPWPGLNDGVMRELSKTGQAILDARAAHPGATLADLYDPDTMPPDLRKAHKDNDRAVDRLYRKKPFESERERVEHLFTLYEKLSAPPTAADKRSGRESREH